MVASSLRKNRLVGVDEILKERPFSLLTSDFLSEEEREENKRWGDSAFKTLLDIDDGIFFPEDMTESEIDGLLLEIIGDSLDGLCDEVHLPTSSLYIAR